MAQPPAYNRGFDFTNLAPANIPEAGVRNNAELDGVSTSVNALGANLALIQRDDGALANQAVTPDSLSSTTRLLIGAGWQPKGDWATATAYVVKDVVSVSGIAYVCLAAHTAGTFATDLAASKWVLVYSPNVVPTAGSITGAMLASGFTYTGDFAATNVTATAALAGATLATTGNATVGGTLAATGAISTSAGVSVNLGAVLDAAGTMPLSTTPVANPVATKSSVQIQATTQTESVREMALVVGVWSNRGGTRANPALATQDKVAIYGGINAVAGTGDVWALNTVATMDAGSGSNYHAQGYELDFNNISGVHRGDADAGSGFSGYMAVGLSVTGASTYRSTSAILVAGPGTGIWNRGISFASSCISSTGSAFQDLCAGHHKSIDIRGTPTWGVYQDAVATKNMFRGNFTYFGAENASPIAAGVNGTTIRTGSGVETFASGDPASTLGRGGDGIVEAFYWWGTAVGSVSVTATTTSFNTSSDYRLKTEVETLTGGLDRVLATPARRFRWKATPNAPKVDGFLAHEAAITVPAAVLGVKDGVGPDNLPVYQAVDQSKLVPVLWAAVQELAGKLTTAEATAAEATAALAARIVAAEEQATTAAAAFEALAARVAALEAPAPAA